MSDETNELHGLRNELAQLRAMLLLMITLALLVLMLGNLVAIFQLPQFEKVFSDVLGGLEKLPQVTRWVLEYGRMQNGQVAIISVTAIPVLNLLFLFLFRRSNFIVVVSGLIMVLLVAHWMIFATAMREPMQRIMLSLAAGPQASPQAQ
ncbi:MAG: hypothetical protein ACOYMN_06200 [Roseimicrobium sp.]